MQYFQNIRSFAHLKKEYRRLAMKYHPDRQGGDEEIMKLVISEFEELFKYWQHRKGEEEPLSGYENDYEGATFEEYVAFVGKEYQWRGKNNKGKPIQDIWESINSWLKQTYPDYEIIFDMRGLDTYVIYLMAADFNPFTEFSYKKDFYFINTYTIEFDLSLTDRAKDVLNNIKQYILSYFSTDSKNQLVMFIGKHPVPYRLYIPTKRHMH